MTTTAPTSGAPLANGVKKEADVVFVGPSTGRVLARVVGPAPESRVHVVTKESVVVGRESTNREADVIVHENNYVSRGHLQLRFDAASSVWKLSCKGKNGVFVESQLVRRDAGEYDLPQKCSLRFPSTDIRLHFESKVPVARAADSVAAAQKLPLTNLLNHNSTSLTGNRKRKFSEPTEAQTIELLDRSASVGCLTPDGKPPFSYAQLIVQAIASTDDKQMTLSGIYAYITKHYPFYRNSEKGWQNSIRHNLSLNRSFIRTPRNPEELTKGSYWRLDPPVQAKLIEQSFRPKPRRRSSSKVRSAPVSPGLPCSGDFQEMLAMANQATAAAFKRRRAFAEISVVTEPPLAPVQSPPVVVLQPPPIAPPEPAFVQHVAPPEQPDFLFGALPASGGGVPERSAALFSQSAPCSPRGFTKDGRRREFRSGGPFTVRTSARDGRNRLQLCHTLPEYVPVSRADMSALQALAGPSAHDRSRNASSITSFIQRGCKSLSTTPVRELLGGMGAPPAAESVGQHVARALHEAGSSPEPKVMLRRSSLPLSDGTPPVNSVAAPVLQTSVCASAYAPGLVFMPRPTSVLAASQMASLAAAAGVQYPAAMLQSAVDALAGSRFVAPAACLPLRAAYPMLHATTQPSAEAIQNAIAAASGVVARPPFANWH